MGWKDAGRLGKDVADMDLAVGSHTEGAVVVEMDRLVARSSGPYRHELVSLVVHTEMTEELGAAAGKRKTLQLILTVKLPNDERD